MGPRGQGEKMEYWSGGVVGGEEFLIFDLRPGFDRRKICAKLEVGRIRRPSVNAT
jgi:hypothetical protein